MINDDCSFSLNLDIKMHILKKVFKDLPMKEGTST